MNDTYLKDKELAERFGIYRTTIWAWVRNDPTFPKPIRLSAQCTRWRMSDILAWEAAKASAER